MKGLSYTVYSDTEASVQLSDMQNSCTLSCFPASSYPSDLSSSIYLNHNLCYLNISI